MAKFRATLSTSSSIDIFLLMKQRASRIQNMVKEDSNGASSEGEDTLVDNTTATPVHVHSRRTSRKQRRCVQKAKTFKAFATLWDLPSELLLSILCYLQPSDIFVLKRTCRSLDVFICQQETTLGKAIIAWRYATLTKCFPIPVLLESVDVAVQHALLSNQRQWKSSIQSSNHKRPYQHISLPDPSLICTCLTCHLAWNNLNVLVDVAYWQTNLSRGEPIPMIPRGGMPKWNEVLLRANTRIVHNALRSIMWYARILEMHLGTIVGSIQRHVENKGNKLRRFLMTTEDVRTKTDDFLNRQGPPTLDFPFHRDNYYMLEAYLPNRGWSDEIQKWHYVPFSQHDRDVEFILAVYNKEAKSLV